MLRCTSRRELQAACARYNGKGCYTTRETMLQRISKGLLALAITASLALGAFAKPAPAVASTGSTYTIIESALALIGGIILYNNYEHKRQAATTVVGYTRNGGTV